MSPTTKTSGWPGSVRSGFTPIRPARSSEAPDCSASVRQRTGLHTGRPDLGDGDDPLGASVLVRTSIPRSSTSVTIAPRMTSTPLFSSSFLASPSFSPNGGSTCGAASSRIAGVAGVDRAEVAREGAVRQLGDLAGHLHPGRAGSDHDERQQVVDFSPRIAPSSAISNAPKIRPRSSRASSMLFMPGANSANGRCRSTLARARCNDQGVVRRDRLAAEHMGRHGPARGRCRHLTEQDPGVPARRLRTSRVAGAISPLERIPVATW